MSFGAELIFASGLGFVVLGPKRMQALLGQLARSRQQVRQLQRDIEAQLSAGPPSSQEGPAIAGDDTT